MPKERRTGIKVHDANLAGEALSLGEGRTPDAVVRATLTDCTVVFRGKSVDVLDCRLVRCRVRGLRSAGNLWLNQVAFEECTFEGSFRGCVFGNDGSSSHDWEPAGVRECDFRAANIHLTRFHRCDARGNRWPGWPQIVVFDVRSHLDDWLSTPLPRELWSLRADTKLDLNSLGETAHGEDLSVDLQGQDIEELRRLLSTKPYIIGP